MNIAVNVGQSNSQRWLWTFSSKMCIINWKCKKLSKICSLNMLMMWAQYIRPINNWFKWIISFTSMCVLGRMNRLLNATSGSSIPWDNILEHWKTFTASKNYFTVLKIIRISWNTYFSFPHKKKGTRSADIFLKICASWSLHISNCEYCTFCF